MHFLSFECSDFAHLALMFAERTNTHAYISGNAEV